MPAFLFTCPECRHELELDERVRGRQIYCPTCGQPIFVPSAQPAEEKATESKKGLGMADRVWSQPFLKSGAEQARTIYNDLRQLSFRDEILPIDQTNISVLSKDWIFWGVTLLGIIPLLIVTINETSTQLTLFALFFAFVWGVIFKRFVLNDNASWSWPIAALFFTGLLGIGLLLFLYRFLLPGFYLAMPDSQNPFVSFLGFILQVGVWEETVKALPVLVLLRWQKESIGPLQFVTIGVFSGLGFAAFENLHYGENAIFSTYSLTQAYGAEGLVTGVQNAMVVTMLRAVSLVFCHAVWSGIVAYFVAAAKMRRDKTIALILVGIAVAAFLHGLYDWLAGVQSTIAAVMAGLSFALFYGYLSKLKAMERLPELPLQKENDLTE